MIHPCGKAFAIPTTGIGPGWRSRLCTDAPLLFHVGPASLRLLIVKKHLGPFADFVMREKIEGRVPVHSGCEIANAALNGGRVALLCVSETERRAKGHTTTRSPGPAIGSTLTASSSLTMLSGWGSPASRIRPSSRHGSNLPSAGFSSSDRSPRTASGQCCASLLAQAFASPAPRVAAALKSKRSLALFPEPPAIRLDVMTARVLLAATLDWPNAARLAIAFRYPGFACCSQRGRAREPPRPCDRKAGRRFPVSGASSHRVAATGPRNVAAGPHSSLRRPCC